MRFLRTYENYSEDFEQQVSSCFEDDGNFINIDIQSLFKICMKDSAGGEKIFAHLLRSNIMNKYCHCEDAISGYKSSGIVQNLEFFKQPNKVDVYVEYKDMPSESEYSLHSVDKIKIDKKLTTAASFDL